MCSFGFSPSLFLFFAGGPALTAYTVLWTTMLATFFHSNVLSALQRRYGVSEFKGKTYGMHGNYLD